MSQKKATIAYEDVTQEMTLKHKAEASKMFGMFSNIQHPTSNVKLYTIATTSISTTPIFGSAATCTVERAGGSLGKNSA